MGVKGPCALSKFMPDFIVGTAIDRMYCIDGGVVKKLLTLWFDSTYSAFPFSLYHVKDIINERILAIKPPKFIHRMPPPTEKLTHWKASELKAWFFYYSVPVLHEVMRNDFFNHLLLLVCGISFLSADSISENMLELARIFLHKFVRQFQELYGQQFCSINIHLVQHLHECVQNLGPLWGYQCYQYEDLNGRILAIINGTTHIDSQIVTAHFQLLKMEKYRNQLPDGDVRDFCFGQKKKLKINERILNNCYSVGAYETIIHTDLPDFVQEAIRFLLPARRIRKYLRLLKNSKVYVSKEYSRSLKTESSYVTYQNNDGTMHYGSIFCFI
ncbi:GSCOCG00011321001-RA-CDS [Cotesia congregata]|nr:GSCOCG00011321001-RA-CDS [Cotesia congregata]